MHCKDCMFYQPSVQNRTGIFPMPGRTERRCSCGVELYYIDGYGAFPGPPYNPPRNPGNMFYDTNAIQADVCPNFRYGDGGYEGGAQPPSGPPLGTSKVGNGNSSCFLTSACVDALGKEDDCYELSTLREFRDGWLSEQEGGKDDIARYYAFAPLVVSEIDGLSNRIQVYTAIYGELVAPCVKLIEQGCMQETWELYKSYTEKLIEKYAVAAA